MEDAGDGYGRGDRRRDRGSRICGGLIGRMMRMGLKIQSCFGAWMMEEESRDFGGEMCGCLRSMPQSSFFAVLVIRAVSEGNI